MVVGVDLPITPIDPLMEFVLCIFINLGSARLEIMVLRERILPPGDTARVLLNSNLWLSVQHFGILVPRN